MSEESLDLTNQVMYVRFCLSSSRLGMPLRAELKDGVRTFDSCDVRHVISGRKSGSKSSTLDLKRVSIRSNRRILAITIYRYSTTKFVLRIDRYSKEMR